MGLPTTWAETMDLFARAVGGEADAREWLRQALRATWGVDDVVDLNHVARTLAFQRTLYVVFQIGENVYDFSPDGGRAAIAEIFARRWGGITLDGPPWRLGPAELDRPTRDEWAATAADFQPPTERS